MTSVATTLDEFRQKYLSEALTVLAENFVFPQLWNNREPQRLIVWHPGQLSEDATLYHRLEAEREREEWEWS